MKSLIKMKKILSFPTLFLPYYVSSFVVSLQYRNSPNRLITARRGNLLRNRLIYLLEKKFKKEIMQGVKEINEIYPEVPHQLSKKIWVCWLQGIEKAPKVVRMCFSSIYRCLNDKYEIVFITNDNWRDYVDIPQDIIDMWENKTISNTHFADILRLNLLVRHGGTWIDATVLCTSPNPPEFMLQSDLFLVQTMIPDRGTFATQIENYFISASQNNKILTLALRLIYSYWRKYDFLLDYHISYDLLQIAIEQYPEVWNRVVPYPRACMETLESTWCQPYDKGTLDFILSSFPFHKLSYKVKYNKGSFCDMILKEVE